MSIRDALRQGDEDGAGVPSRVPSPAVTYNVPQRPNLPTRSTEKIVEKLVEVPVPMKVDEESGIVWIGNLGVSRRGLYLKPETSYDEWTAFVEVLRSYKDSLSLIIGDWLAFGERAWGATYEQVAGYLGYKVETLRDWVWVCNAVDISLRNDVLFFQHYRLVASLSHDEQYQWLRKAIIGSGTESDPKPWSARRLEAEIAGLPKLPSGPQKTRLDRFRAAFWSGYQRSLKIAAKATSDERAAMAAELRRLADELDRGG